MAEDSNTAVAEVKTKKVDPVALSIYGDKFTHYNRIGEIREMIPAFKEFYYTERQKNAKVLLSDMLQRFNKEIAYPEGITQYVQETVDQMNDSNIPVTEVTAETVSDIFNQIILCSFL